MDNRKSAAHHCLASQSPSFPNASIGNLGETGTGPPIQTFGGDAFRVNYHRYVRIPVSLLRVSSVWKNLT